MEKSTIIGLLVLLVIVVGGLFFTGTISFNSPTGKAVDNNNYIPPANNNYNNEYENFCNEVSISSLNGDCVATPISDTAKNIDCYITVSGDSRAKYRADIYLGYNSYLGREGGVTGTGQFSAGQRTNLDANHFERVEVTPVYKNYPCNNKKAIIYRNEFSGENDLVNS